MSETKDPRAHLAETIVALRAAFAAFEAAYRDSVRRQVVLLDVPERVPAYIDGPRAGKGAKIIYGTISREEFSEAYAEYRRRGGQQELNALLREGFSVQELESLLGQAPISWIEDKLEEVQIDQGQAGGEKLLRVKLEDAPNTAVVDKPSV
jgi:hypothetical protein